MVRGEMVMTLVLGLVLCMSESLKVFSVPPLSAFLSIKPEARLERSLVGLMGIPSHLPWARVHSEG